MTDADRIARIRAYLDQNRDTYTRAALRQRLVADGHPLADIDEAMVQVYGAQVEASPADTPASVSQISESPSTTSVVLIGLAFAMLNSLLACVVVFSAISGVAGISSSLLGVLGIPVLVLLLLEGGLAFGIRDRNPTLSRGLVWGIILSLAFVVLGGLLFGVCLALLGVV